MSESEDKLEKVAREAVLGTLAEKNLEELQESEELITELKVEKQTKRVAQALKEARKEEREDAEKEIKTHATCMRHMEVLEKKIATLESEYEDIHQAFHNSEKFLEEDNTKAHKRIAELEAGTFKENMTDVSELSRNLVEKNEKIAELEQIISVGVQTSIGLAKKHLALEAEITAFRTINRHKDKDWGKWYGLYHKLFDRAGKAEAKLEEAEKDSNSNNLTTVFCSSCDAEKKESLRLQKYWNDRCEKQSEKITELEGKLKLKDNDIDTLIGAEKRLEGKLKEYKDDRDSCFKETCTIEYEKDNRTHCTCVPGLRDVIKDLEQAWKSIYSFPHSEFDGTLLEWYAKFCEKLEAGQKVIQKQERK